MGWGRDRISDACKYFHGTTPLGPMSHVWHSFRTYAGPVSVWDLHHSRNLHGRPDRGTLTANRVPYKAGIAKYSELAKSMMLGDEAGMLKLLFDRQTRKLLGVHALGQRPTEIIHIGQAVLCYGGSVEYFRDIVFNYPTLAEAYKVAALDGQAVISPTEGALSVFSMDRCLRKATPPFFQPTARPTKCRVLHDLRCVGSLRISCKLL